MAYCSDRRTLRLFSVLLTVSFFFIRPAYADTLDPQPVFTTLTQSPPRAHLSFSGNEKLIFCPLTENFYNPDDETAVQTLILEAVGEGYRGMVAVGEVIRNRSKRFMKSNSEICLMPKQFSCWNDRARASEFLEKYRQYRFIAYLAWLESEHSDWTRGATDYHADSIHPYWAAAYRESARIGAHIFYTRETPADPLSLT